jgi:hypothetical protein
MNSSKDMGELVKHIFSLLAPFFLSPIVPSTIFSICQQFLALSAIFSSFSHFQLSAYHRKKGEGDMRVG